MRSLHIKEGIRQAKKVLKDAGRLAGTSLPATAMLALSLAVLPALLKALLLSSSQAAYLSVWEGWLSALFSGRSPAESLVSMAYQALGRPGLHDPALGALDLAVSLLLTPLLLSALSLLYNGFVPRSKSQAFDAVRRALASVRALVLVALACMLAEWLAQVVPSTVSGLLYSVAGLLSFIPFVGQAAAWLSVLLSLLVSALTDFLVSVVFCYVWISASCEGVSGLGALVRSWQLTRLSLRETIASLAVLLLLRWAATVALFLLWLFAGRALHVPIQLLVYGGFALSGLYTAALGPVASALYLRRPASHGPFGGRPAGAGPNFDHMKRANVDD